MVELKSQRELALMRAAGRVNARALAAMRDALKPGVTTRELDRIADRVIRQHKAVAAFKGVPGHKAPYPFATTISVNAELIHGMPGKRVIRDGDVVKLDCGTNLNGWFADSAITVGVGAIADQARWLIEVTAGALQCGIALARPGNRLGDIGHAIEYFVEDGHGLAIAPDYTGHGLGRSLHEPPEVPNTGRPGRGLVLKPGMTLAIEPMVMAGAPELDVAADGWTVIAADGALTAHFEHTVAIVDGEPWVLTTE
jgi:methionyl aminopeptidase